MKNLVLGTAAVLALVACSKKTPDADTTTTTSGAQNTAIPQTTVTPATPANADNNNVNTPATPPMQNANNFKDAGHVDSVGAGAGTTTGQGGPNGIGQPIDRNGAQPTMGTTTGSMGAKGDSMKDQRKAPVDKPDTSKVHGNGTTPGTTGQMNGNH